MVSSTDCRSHNIYSIITLAALDLLFIPAWLSLLFDLLPVHLAKFAFALLPLGGSFATIRIGSDHSFTPGRVLDPHPGRFAPAPLLEHSVAELANLETAMLETSDCNVSNVS